MCCAHALVCSVNDKKAPGLTMEEYETVYRYLESSAYPDGLSKETKRNFRWKCTENYKIKNGQLFHRRCDRKKEQHETDELRGEWKLCIVTEEEKARVLRIHALTSKFAQQDSPSYSEKWILNARHHCDPLPTHLSTVTTLYSHPTAHNRHVMWPSCDIPSHSAMGVALNTYKVVKETGSWYP